MLKDFQLIMTEFLEELSKKESNSISTGYKILQPPTYPKIAHKRFKQNSIAKK